MTKNMIRSGFLIGLSGGGLMALFAMTAMWATGHGFFTVVNSFSHTFWKDAPLDGTFTLASFELGLLIHVTVSTIVGTLIAALAERGHLDAGMVLAVGIGVGACVWVVQAVAWSSLDPSAHSLLTPWILAAAHFVFAIGAATFLMALGARGAEQSTTSTIDEQSPAAHPSGGGLPRPSRSGFTRTHHLLTSDVD